MIAWIGVAALTAIAFMCGYVAGRANERARCLRIVACIDPYAGSSRHEFWKGYAACAESFRGRIRGAR